MRQIRTRSGLGGVSGRKWCGNCLALAVLLALTVWMVPVRAYGQQLYMYRGRDGRIMFAKAPAAAHDEESSTAASAKPTLHASEDREPVQAAWRAGGDTESAAPELLK